MLIFFIQRKLAKLTKALKLRNDPDEWQEFMDLAAVAKNELPEDLQDNERIASVLPAFYRTINSIIAKMYLKTS